MTINAPEAVSPGAVTGFGMGTPATGTTSPTTQANKDMFMELLVTQLRYQDPLNPTSSGEFLAQSAQFTSLEKMEAVAQQTAMMLSTQLAFGASGLVGREITWTDAEGVNQTGQVAGVTFGPQGPVLDVDGTEVPLALVETVRNATAAASPDVPPVTQSSPDTPSSQSSSADALRLSDTYTQ